MKAPAAYFLLLIYLTIVVKPVLPYVDDALSHLFAEAKHLATVHARLGNHHLQHELADAHDDDDDHEHQPATPKAEDQISLHLGATHQETDVRLIAVRNLFLPVKAKALPVVFISIQGPPPKFSC